VATIAPISRKASKDNWARTCIARLEAGIIKIERTVVRCCPHQSIHFRDSEQGHACLEALSRRSSVAGAIHSLVKFLINPTKKNLFITYSKLFFIPNQPLDYANDPFISRLLQLSSVPIGEMRTQLQLGNTRATARKANLRRKQY
jgi:hypothetical protein